MPELSPPSTESRAALDHFLAVLLEDAALQARLALLREPAAFGSAMVAAAAEYGIAIDFSTVEALLAPDPLDLGRFDRSPANCTAWPPLGWLPTTLLPTDGGWAIDWKHFGGVRLKQPFFHESTLIAQDLPLSRLLRWRISLGDLVARAPVAPSAPSGFIYHMSRCGSTLVAQMIAAMDTVAMVSEPPVLDELLQLLERHPGVSFEERAALLRAMIGALGRAAGEGGEFVVKLDSWHSALLPLFRHVFPDTPWVYLYRDPVEVLVSQVRQRAGRTIPGFGDLAFELGDYDVDSIEYCARFIARSCEDALTHHALGGGIVIDYAELPDAVEGRILPHFGIVADAAARAAMAGATLRDAKQPARHFVADSAEKRAGADLEIKALVAQILEEPVRRLAALRATGG